MSIVQSGAPGLDNLRPQRINDIVQSVIGACVVLICCVMRSNHWHEQLKVCAPFVRFLDDNSSITNHMCIIVMMLCNILYEGRIQHSPLLIYSKVLLRF